jgi:hypothetical protein
VSTILAASQNPGGDAPIPKRSLEMKGSMVLVGEDREAWLLSSDADTWNFLVSSRYFLSPSNLHLELQILVLIIW